MIYDDDGIIFDDQEMKLLKVEKGWSQDELLSQQGMFFLKDIVKRLELDNLKISNRAIQLGDRSWLDLGVKKVWGHWIVKMSVFKNHWDCFLPDYQCVKNDWTAEKLLEQKGLFLLSAICRVLPVTPYQIRQEVKKEKCRIIWKDGTRFVLDMETFAPWFKSRWEIKN